MDESSMLSHSSPLLFVTNEGPIPQSAIKEVSQNPKSKEGDEPAKKEYSEDVCIRRGSALI